MIKELAQYVKTFKSGNTFKINITCIKAMNFTYEVIVDIIKTNNDKDDLTVYHNKAVSLGDVTKLEVDSLPAVNDLKVSNRLINYIIKEIFLPAILEESVGLTSNTEEEIKSTIIIKDKKVEQQIFYRTEEIIECVKMNV